MIIPRAGAISRCCTSHDVQLTSLRGSGGSLLRCDWGRACPGCSVERHDERVADDVQAAGLRRGEGRGGDGRRSGGAGVEGLAGLEIGPALFLGTTGRDTGRDRHLLQTIRTTSSRFRLGLSRGDESVLLRIIGLDRPDPRLVVGDLGRHPRLIAGELREGRQRCRVGGREGAEAPIVTRETIVDIAVLPQPKGQEEQRDDERHPAQPAGAAEATAELVTMGDGQEPSTVLLGEQRVGRVVDRHVVTVERREEAGLPNDVGQVDVRGPDELVRRILDHEPVTRRIVRRVVDDDVTRDHVGVGGGSDGNGRSLEARRDLGLSRPGRKGHQGCDGRVDVRRGNAVAGEEALDERLLHVDSPCLASDQDFGGVSRAGNEFAEQKPDSNKPRTVGFLTRRTHIYNIEYDFSVQEAPFFIAS